MTKEELYKRIGDVIYRDMPIKVTLAEFFKSNVVIPRGENRHPDADVLHAYVEDVTQTVEYMNVCNQWESFIALSHTELRIKPAEPVYEWQWLLYSDSTKAYCRGVTSSHYISKDEYYKFVPNGYYIEPLEETRRERK